jgi:flagellar FliL protein
MLVALGDSMSDDLPLKPAEPPPAAAKSSKAVLGLLMLNLGASGFAVFKLLTASPAEAAAPAAHHVAEVSASEITGPVVEMPPFVVNLDEPGTSRYLKVTLQIELFPAAEHVLEKSKQAVRDTILSHLSGLHLKDTLGAEAKERIRNDLTAKIGKLIGPDKIRRLFFQDFVVQ